MNEALHDVPIVPALLQDAVIRHAARPFLISPNGVETFAETGVAIELMAARLARSRVGAGDRVLLQAVNAPAVVHAWLATMRVGALPAPVNTALTRVELTQIISDIMPTLVLADAAHLAGAHAAAASIGVQVEALEAEAPVGAEPPEPPSADAFDPAALVFTSGTTSRAKAALVTHAAYVLTGESFPSWLDLNGRDRLWTCMPLFHLNAQAYALMTALAHGMPLALSARFSASGFWREAAAFGATTTNVVGAMLEMLARQPVETFQKSALRTIYAAPAPAGEQRAHLERRFGVRIVSGYGMTELPFGAIDSPTSREKTNSVGRPRCHPWRPFGNELRITAEGSEVPRGEVGELQFRNASVSPGYWNAPDATASTREDGGWFRTGDLGCVDADGDIVLTGRVKEMIRRRGENIAPLEIEEALMAHPAVLAAAGFGVPSELTEEDVAAAVVLRAGAQVTPEELRTWCAERLAPFKVPEWIAVREALPMTPTMRVAKDALARELLEG